MNPCSYLKTPNKHH
jgi:serine/threonine protein phosphatase PrpC